MAVAATIFRILFVWFAVCLLSGLWADCWIFQRLWPRRVRALLLPISGLTTHLLLVTNLSFWGVPADRAWWIALLAAAGAAAPGWKRWPELQGLAQPLGLSLILILLGALPQIVPEIKVGKVTTVPAENGDWLTYIAHSDVFTNHGYYWEPRVGEFDEVGAPIRQYHGYHFRIGASILFASFSVIAGLRGMFVFNVFCGFLLGLGVCAFALLLRQLRVPSGFALAALVVWALHPTPNWAAFASFVPQMAGMALSLCIVALSPAALSPRGFWPKAFAGGLLFAGLMAAYNEMIPQIMAAVLLSYILVIRLDWRRYRRVGLLLAAMFGVAILLSPQGMLLGIQGMITQIRISPVTGGGMQALNDLIFFLGACAGFLPLPPIPELSAAIHALAWFRLVLPALLLLGLGAGAGVWFSRRWPRTALPAWLLVDVCLAVYIMATYPIVQYRNWAIYKLAQYAVPLVLALAAIAVARVWRWRAARPFAGAAAGMLGLAMCAQSFFFVSNLPRTPITQNSPRFWFLVTTTDAAFVDEISKLAGPQEAILSLNSTDPASSYPPSAGQLIYPRPLLHIQRISTGVDLPQARFAVVDKIGPRIGAITGDPLWENARFAIYARQTDQPMVELSKAATARVDPAAFAGIPKCSAGGALALHTFSFQPVKLSVSGDSPAEETVQTVGGESLLLAPVACSANGFTPLRLQANGPVWLIDSEWVATAERMAAIKGAIAHLAGGDGDPSLLPDLSQPAWPVATLDWTPKLPEIQFSRGQVSVSAPDAASIGISAPVQLTPGWYSVREQFSALKPAAGAGKGYGVGLLRDPRYLWFVKTPGTHLIEELLFVANSKQDNFSLVVGGSGWNSGSVVFQQPELRRLRYQSLQEIR